MLSYRNNGIVINIKYSKLSSLKYCMCREYRKKIEPQVKLHRIITKVQKFICFTHTKILTSAIFFNSSKILWIQSTHTTCAKVWLTPPTHATHAIYATRKINVNHKLNRSTHYSRVLLIYTPWKHRKA